METAWAPDARRARIVVADDGPGIAAEDREQLFVPYFSTKATGMGLGLSDRAPDRHRPRRHHPGRGQRCRGAAASSSSCPPASSRRPGRRPRRGARRHGRRAHPDRRRRAARSRPRSRRARGRGLPRDRGRLGAGGARPDRTRSCRTSSSSTSGCRAWTASRPSPEIQRLHARAAVVMISGHGTIETAVKATKLGAYDFIEKPLSLEKTLLAAGARPRALAARAREPRAPRAARPRAGDRRGRAPLIDGAAPADRAGRAHATAAC